MRLAKILETVQDWKKSRWVSGGKKNQALREAGGTMRTNLKPAPIKTKTNLDQPKDQPWTNLLRLVSGARPTSRPFRVKTLLLNTILSLFILKVGLGLVRLVLPLWQ